jgi:hypothetical protein
MQPTISISVAMLVVAAVVFALSLRAFRLARAERDCAEEARDEYRGMMAVDPWHVQRRLMAMSAQPLPLVPTLNNGVLLYAMLNMEELAEMLDHLSTSVARRCDVSIPLNQSLSIELRRYGERLAHWSRYIRSILKEHDIGEHELPPDEARDLLDDTADLSVTNCGFAASAGLPGAAGYGEVQDSNISKGNPETGMIDKTPDGKWIKGVNYREPDLLGVLAITRPGWAARHGLACGSQAG